MKQITVGSLHDFNIDKYILLQCILVHIHITKSNNKLNTSH